VTAPANTKIQFNFKTPGGDLHNVYAVDADEAEELLDALFTLLPKVNDTATAIRGVAAAGQSLGATAVDAPVQQQQFVPQQRQAPAQEAAPAATGGQFCHHGAMTHKSAAPGSGKKWAAWFCPGPKGDQCKPIDAKTGKPWG
jgi:hypothetical protein